MLEAHRNTEMLIDNSESGEKMNPNSHDRGRSAGAFTPMVVNAEALDELYATVPAMMHSIDASGQLVRVSDKWLATLGFERSEVIGQISSDFLTDESRAYARNVVLPEFFKSGRCDDVEYQMVCKDGRVIDVLLSATLQCDEVGRSLRSISVIRDITDKKGVDRALVESERRYRALFHHVHAGFALLHLDIAGAGEGQFKFVAVNPTFASLCGLDHQDVVQTPVPKVLASLLQASSDCEIILREVALTGVAHELPDQKGPTGRWFDVISYSPEINQCAILVQETSQKKRMQKELSQQHEQIRVTLQSIGDAVISTDRAGRVQYLNPVAEKLTGWSLYEAKGKFIEKVFQIFDERTGVKCPNPVDRCLAENCTIFLRDGVKMDSRSGGSYSISDSAAPITNEEGRVTGVVVVFRDVTEQRRIANEMAYRATHDSLTGLLNRAEFEDRLRSELEEVRLSNRLGAVLYVDLDQFKLINDTFGHAGGDDLLRRLSYNLEENINWPHSLARLGGDEFGIILMDCPITKAAEIAGHICRQIDDLRYEYRGHTICVGASIGLVPLGSGLGGVREVMQLVDSACYAAKDAGRNRVCIWSEADRTMSARKDEMDWVNRLRQALDENRFELFAQKICALSSSDRGLRFEVLLRLRDDKGQLISPKAFLPAAEKFGIASRIDRWVVRHVFEWMVVQGESLGDVESISVNLSGQTIGDALFLEYIAEMLDDLPVDPRKLCFEVTETAAITNFEAAISLISTLKGFGVRFALDDFGSGTSSFGYLKILPVDYLKIDGQFVRDLAGNEVDQTIVRCIQEIAAILGKQTIAEFVESEEVAVLLTKMGIGSGQGFYFHHPESLDTILTRRPSIMRD